MVYFDVSKLDAKLTGKIGKRNMEKRIKNKYLIYTICFWSFAGPLIYYISSLGLFAGGHSDAIWQHYPIMVYIRRFLIEFFSAIAHREAFVFPMVDFSIGMGDDVIAALNYYGFGDPFYLLTVFVSEENLPYFYSVFFYFRVYLGGIAFIALASELDRTKSEAAYVIGALIYSFSGFAVQCNMHIIFTHAMFYTPLMLLGAEKSMHGKRKGLLCAATFCFALSGFYFLYIASVSLGVYVIYRMYRENRKLAEAAAMTGRLITEYVLGLGLASVAFIPSVLGFLSSNRAEVQSNDAFISSWEYIKSSLLNMFQPSYDNLGQETAVCTIGMITLICALLSKKAYAKVCRKNLLALFLLTIIPLFNYIMSGFGTTNSRWQFVISMYTAFVAVTFWDALGELSTLQKSGIVLAYLLLCVVGKKKDILMHERFRITLLSYGILLAVIMIVLPVMKKLEKQKTGRIILFLAVYLTICLNWRAIMRDRDIEALQFDRIFTEVENENEQEEFYRIDDQRGIRRMNLALQQGYYGTMEYVSIPNKRYVDIFEKWNISKATHMTWSGLDQRAVLETMCAVKYFIGNADEGTIPYGFEYVKSTKDGEWSIYKNKYALPIAYTYDKIYAFEDYRELSGIEKQQVMLQAAALENNTGGGI